MDKFQKIFYMLGYYEWLLVISLVTLEILAIVFGGFDAGMLTLIMCAAVIPCAFLHHSSGRNFDSDKLFKYKIKYRVVNVDINGKTYYIPVAQFISKYGYLYDFIIDYHQYSFSSSSVSLDDRYLNYRLEQLKKDPVNEINSCHKGHLWHENEEDALFVIKQYKEKIENEAVQRNSVNFSSTSVNFKK